MAITQDNKRRPRRSGRYNFDRPLSEAMKSEWNSPERASISASNDDEKLVALILSSEKGKAERHAPAPRRKRPTSVRRQQAPKQPRGWRPTAVIGVIIGLVSFGVAFDFAGDGKIRHFFQAASPPSESVKASASVERKDVPTVVPQQLATAPDPVIVPAQSPPVAAQIKPALPPVPHPIEIAPPPSALALPAAKAIEPELPVAKIIEPMLPVAKAIEPEPLPKPLPEALVVTAPPPPVPPPAPETPKLEVPAQANTNAVVQADVLPSVVPDKVVLPEKVTEPEVEVKPEVVVKPEVAAKPVVAPLQQGNVIRDCADCPQLVAVTAGSFMKSDDAHPNAPATLTTVDHNFAIGRFEITFDQWDVCVSDGVCKTTAEDGGWGRGLRPKIYVSYEDVTSQYLPWLSKLTGNAYRLPTQEEWQYAAAGGSGTAQAKSHSDTTAKECFNASGPAVDTCTDGFNSTAPVGSFAPSALGLYDMQGNVWEWSADCWQPFTYAANTDTSACDTRLVLGGAWSTGRNKVNGQITGWEKSSRKTNSIGFRVVRSLP